MKNKILIPILALFLIVVVTASPLSEFMSEEVSNLKITINQNQSQAEFFINTKGTSFDEQQIVYENINLGKINISDFLNGVDYSIFLENGKNYPIIKDISILSGSITQTIMDLVFFFVNTGFNVNDINLNPAILENYIKTNYPSPINMYGNASFEKLGNSYKVYYNKGYGEVPDNYLDMIRKVINQSSYFMSVETIINSFAPIPDSISFVESLSYELVDINLTNLNSTKLEDGDYTIKIKVRNGNEIVEKDILISLYGIVNEEERVILNETYIPVIPEISGTILNITGLKNISSINIKIFDIANFVTPPQYYKPLKYFNITTDIQTTAEIYFRILKSKIGKPEKVSLFVLENVWVKLPTQLVNSIGDYYEYKSQIPHFSIFIVGEDTYEVNVVEERSSSHTDNAPYIPLIPVKNTSIPYLDKKKEVIEIAQPEKEKSGIGVFLLFGISLLGIVVLIVGISLLKKKNKTKELENETKK